MLIIGKEQVNSLIGRLSDSSQLSQCQDEVKKMLEIKSALLWWAESGKCCMWQLGSHLADEIQILEETLKLLDNGNPSQASSLLTKYADQLAWVEGAEAHG